MTKKKHKYEKCAEHKPEIYRTTECKECGVPLKALSAEINKALFG